LLSVNGITGALARPMNACLYVWPLTAVANVVALTACAPRNGRLASTRTVPLFWVGVHMPPGGTSTASSSKSSQNVAVAHTAESSPVFANSPVPVPVPASGASGSVVLTAPLEEPACATSSPPDATRVVGP
jgi:hypothetical protein